MLDVKRSIEVHSLINRQRQKFESMLRVSPAHFSTADLLHEEVHDLQLAIELILPKIPKDVWACQLPNEVINQQLRELESFREEGLAKIT